MERPHNAFSPSTGQMSEGLTISKLFAVPRDFFARLTDAEIIVGALVSLLLLYCCCRAVCAAFSNCPGPADARVRRIQKVSVAVT